MWDGCAVEQSTPQKPWKMGVDFPLLLKIRIPFCKSHQSHQSHQTLLLKKKNSDGTWTSLLTWSLHYFPNPSFLRFHVVVVFWKSIHDIPQQRNFQRMTSCSCGLRISSALYPLAPNLWCLGILHGSYGAAYDLIGVGPIIVFATHLGALIHWFVTIHW